MDPPEDIAEPIDQAGDALGKKYLRGHNTRQESEGVQNVKNSWMNSKVREEGWKMLQAVEQRFRCSQW